MDQLKVFNSISSTALKERTITSKPRFGEKIIVETPTSLLGNIKFSK